MIMIILRSTEWNILNKKFNLQKPYRCTVDGCGKRYTDPSSLRKHVKNHAEISSMDNKSPKQNICGSLSDEDKNTSMDASYRVYDNQITADKNFAGVTGDWTKLEVMDESQPEFVPFESVARILGDDESCIIDGVGKSIHK